MPSFDELLSHPYLGEGLFVSIVTWLDDSDVWRLRMVSRAFKQLVDRYYATGRLWHQSPRKIDAWPEGVGVPRRDLLGLAKSAIDHFHAILTSAAPTVTAKAFTGPALTVFGKISSTYQAETGKQLFNNCVCVFDSGVARPFVLNFLPGGDSHGLASALTKATGEQLALDVMLKTGFMHAEVRVLHEGRAPRSIDKPMCVFCAMTYRQAASSTIYPYHERKLAWYTFSPRILVSNDRIRQYFGDAFASAWRAELNEVRTTLLALTILLTNRKIYDRFFPPPSDPPDIDRSALLIKRPAPSAPDFSRPAKRIGPECPKCFGSMVLRTGPFGEFWGCSRYPICKGTVK